jgi:hypothetical protein
VYAIILLLEVGCKQEIYLNKKQTHIPVVTSLILNITIYEPYIQLTPWSRVLEKLIFAQLVKKFPAFCESLKFFIMLTRAGHWSLS